MIVLQSGVDCDSPPPRLVVETILDSVTTVTHSVTRDKPATGKLTPTDFTVDTTV